MALNLGELVAYITAEDSGFRRTVDDARRAMERLNDGTGRGLGRLAGVVGGTVGTLTEMTRAALRAGLSVATIGTAALSVAPLLAPVAVALFEVGAAAVAAGPALLALGAAGLIVKTALTAIFAEGTATRKALEPLGAMLTKAAEAGSLAAAKGIRPLAQALREVAQPVVVQFMEGIGQAANRVQKDFLRWAKSADGVRTLRSILGPISGAMGRLAPAVSRVAVAFTRMLGRIMGVSVAAGSSGLAGALDWLARKMDAVNQATVGGGLAKLRDTAITVGNAVQVVAGWIGKLVQAYRTYTTEFRVLADAVSVAAIIFGGPIVAAIGAAGLIIRHFDALKAAWERLKAAFSGGGGGGPIATAFRDMRAAASTVLPALKTAFAQIKTAVLPPLREIWTLIKTDLIPTFAAFQKAIAPVVAWLVGVLGPVVATTFASILNVIKGALNIIIGVVKIFIAIFNGDWSKAWEGIQQIARGAWQIIGAIFRAGVALVKGILQLLWGVLKAIWSRGLQIASSGAKALVTAVARIIRSGARTVRGAITAVKNAIVGVFRSAGSWLVGAGRRILDGLISGIRSAIGRVRSLLSSVTGMIPDWKGPMSVDMRLLEPSGEAIMGGLLSGIAASLPALRRMLGGVTDGIASAFTPTLAGPGSAAPAGAGQAGRLEVVRVVFDVRGADGEMKRMIRKMVRVDGRGSAQVAFGTNK